jgi:hypothetical protein
MTWGTFKGKQGFMMVKEYIQSFSCARRDTSGGLTYNKVSIVNNIVFYTGNMLRR